MHGKVNRNNVDNLFFLKKRENIGRCNLSTTTYSAQQTDYSTQNTMLTGTKQKNLIAPKIS